MLCAYDASRVSDIEILDIRSEQIALPQPENNDLTRISKIWSEIGIQIVARQAFDNPALHVFYNRDFWFILPRGIIVMVLFLPVGHIFGSRHWRGCHIPDTMSEKNASIRTRFCAPSGRPKWCTKSSTVQ